MASLAPFGGSRFLFKPLPSCWHPKKLLCLECSPLYSTYKASRTTAASHKSRRIRSTGVTFVVQRALTIKVFAREKAAQGMCLEVVA